MSAIRSGVAWSARKRVGTSDGSPTEAAAKLNLTLEEFRGKLADLLRRRFPAADETTGMYDLDAIDRWRALRHPHLFPELTEATGAADARLVFEQLRGAIRGGRS